VGNKSEVIIFIALAVGQCYHEAVPLVSAAPCIWNLRSTISGYTAWGTVHVRAPTPSILNEWIVSTLHLWRVLCQVWPTSVSVADIHCRDHIRYTIDHGEVVKWGKSCDTFILDNISDVI